MVFLFCLFFFVATILDPCSHFSNGPIISDADVSVLTWLKENTSYEKSPFVKLIYSNNDPSKLHSGWNAPAKIYEVVQQRSSN